VRNGDDPLTTPSPTEPIDVGPLPLGLWFAAILLIISGVVLLLAAAGLSQGILTGGLLGLTGSSAGRIAIGLIGGASIAAGIGMAMRVPAAWGLGMLLVGVGLVAQLVAYFRGDPNLVRLAIYVAMAFYLNQRPVREVFLRRPSKREV
jgi:hypothetical protein